MAEYIDKERLLHRFNIDDMMNVNGTLISLNDARNAISSFPAADVVPVVRCKDCKYGEFVKRGSKYSCRKVEGLLNFCNFYCKDGVRKESDT